MSKETMAWLNNMTLIGFTDKRGMAWHYKASEQGSEPNHYTGAIPMADVERRLFDWQAIELPVSVQLPDGSYALLDDRKAIARSDTYDVMGMFKSGYQAHQYDEWLLDTVGIILSDEIGIASAGLLRKGAQAWVSVEVPENVTTPEGVEFRPNLIACTSLDGSLATTYKRTVTLVVCDNTLAAGLSESGQTYKVKHTRYSSAKIEDAREALAIVSDIADSFSDTVADLASWEVTASEWQKVLDEVTPIVTDSKRGETVSRDKRDKLDTLYNHDNRVEPWKGTAFGVLQAFNTYNHHFAGVRGEVSRSMRNAENVLSGKFEKADDEVITALRKVTNRVA